MIDSTLKKAHILIVDDQEANIDILVGLLEFQGYTNVKSTTDPRMVKSMFKTFNPDLILLDLLMPHLTGFEVMEQLKTLIPQATFLPVLVLTADITVETKQRALANGANDFLVKPFDLIETGLRVRILLEARFMHLQLENQNRILEEKVKERTAELETANIHLYAAKEKAEASDRMKTAFMQNISHEVRTPLNGLLGFGSLLAEPDLDDESRQQYLSMMKSSSDRLINTITDYIDISLIVSDSVEVFSRPVIINNIMMDLQNKFENIIRIKQLEFNLVISDDKELFCIQTDPELLTRIMFHLHSNAVKFTQQGQVTMGYSVDSEKIEFFVKDTGAGIEKEARERVFESFMQENITNTRGHEGSGLGLSIIRGFSKALGGEIRLESEKGKGSSFYFSLPLL